MSNSDIEIDLLRAFLAVAETGSFTSAGDVINRSQSAVSQKIIRLEQLLGETVFERTSRSLALTDKGYQLLESSRRLLMHYETFLNELDPRSAPTRLRLGMTENLVPSQLASLLSRFTACHPDVELELSTGLSHQLIQDQEAGRLDLVIAKRAGSTPGPGQVIWREPLVWIAASGYQLDRVKPLRLVTMPPPCGYRDVMTEALVGVKREWVYACQANNLMSLQAAVVGGLGITALGASFVQAGLQVLGEEAGLPPLPTTEVVLIGESSSIRELKQSMGLLLTEGLRAVGRNG